jgi:hypothetical protein
MSAGEIKTGISLCVSNLDNLDDLDRYQIDQIKDSAQSNRSDYALDLIYLIY